MDEAAGMADAGGASPHAPTRGTGGYAFEATMVVDRADKVFWGVAGCVAVFVLAMSLVVGGVGPDVFDVSGDWAFACPLGADNRTCDPACAGCIPTFTANNTFVRFLDGLSDLNQFFALELGFVSKDYVERTYDAYDLDVELLRQVAGGGYQKMRGNLEHGLELDCGSGQPACDSLLVVLEPYIDASSYETVISLPDSLANTEWIANIHFVFTTVTASFTVLAVSTRVVYALVTIFVAAAFTNAMGGLGALSLWVAEFRITSFSPVLSALGTSRSRYVWQYEQRAALGLMFAFLIHTNPFFPFDLVVHNWAASAATAFASVVFEGVVLFVILITFARYHHAAVLCSSGARRAASLPHGAWFYGPKVAVVGALTFLLWLGLVLVNAELARDPVRAWNGDHAFAMYVFLIQVLWILTLVYALIVVIMAGLKVRPDMVFYNRYLYFSSLTATYLFCISFAALTGNLRPTSSFAYLFFFALRACFVFGFALGAWPATPSGLLACSWTPSDAVYVPTAAAASNPLLGASAPHRSYSAGPVPAAIPVAPRAAVNDVGYAYVEPHLNDDDGEFDDDDGMLNVELQPAQRPPDVSGDADADPDASAFPSAGF